jgi:hypothetical protein
MFSAHVICRSTPAASACARVVLTGRQAGNASCSHASPCSPKGHSQRPSAALQLPRLVQSGWQARAPACGSRPAGARISAWWSRCSSCARHLEGKLSCQRSSLPLLPRAPLAHLFVCRVFVLRCLAFVAACRRCQAPAHPRACQAAAAMAAANAGTARGAAMQQLLEASPDARRQLPGDLLPAARAVRVSARRGVARPLLLIRRLGPLWYAYRMSLFVLLERRLCGEHQQDGDEQQCRDKRRAAAPLVHCDSICCRLTVLHTAAILQRRAWRTLSQGYAHERGRRNESISPRDLVILVFGDRGRAVVNHTVRNAMVTDRKRPFRPHDTGEAIIVSAGPSGASRLWPAFAQSSGTQQSCFLDPFFSASRCLC